MSEINIVVVETKSEGIVASAFQDPSRAVEWFKKLKEKGFPVSVMSVEIDSSEPFLISEELGGL